MRIAFVYPPYVEGGGFPHISQNRQTRYTKSAAVRIYPLVPSSLLTMADRAGHEALLLDAINRRLPRDAYEPELRRFRPGMVVLESKTPIMPKLWREVSWLKEVLPGAVVVLVGDHVTALPQESLDQCPCDYIALGGDYDVEVASLVEHLSKGAPFPPGIVSRSGALSAQASLVEDLDVIPDADRELTRWRDYGEAYLMMPAMYILSGRGCGAKGRSHPGCSFCSWQHNLWRGRARLRSPERFVAEISALVRKYGIPEFFDDNESGGFWDVEWTRQICERLRSLGLHRTTAISSNARADALSDEVCRELSRSGFRLLKVGLESANGETLRCLRKGETPEEIEAGVKRAKDYGLRILLTVMVGYPWETEEETAASLQFARKLLCYKARMGDSLQCSILIPYPGTPLYRDACNYKWYAISPADYDRFAMDNEVLRSRVDTRRWCHRFWRLYLDRAYVWRLLSTTRSLRDLRLGIRGLASLSGHLSDYRGPIATRCRE